ncbi:hypothetical protein L1987_72670 [Smallanthus sonchifolius]|uniref:Uncharacterized protein n=1 Tax=Smallanthus sonchifolius TaxID=185202 RepID=A0ACB9AVV6_9ASTR|nr:hypothetical protein L1987_72670 [Smallanthus sonchifolius]
MISDQTRRQKSREVSSRYLSSTVAPPSPPLGLNHPIQKQKHKHTGFIRGLWPSSTSKTNNDKQSENSPVLSKQKSCSEIRHSEKHYTPVLGGSSSRRFTGKLLFPGRLSSTKSSDEFDSNQVILPGRLSVDENALRRRSSYYQMRSDSFSDNSESSDLSSPLTTGRNSPASYMAPTLSSKMSGIDVSSKYISPSMSMHNSPKNSTLKTTMKRTNSLSSSSSPSRLGSPLFSSSKPPTSSSRGKKNLLHIGLDLIKGKKGGSKFPSSPVTDTGTNMEHVHRLRLLQNSLMQWRYVNARAQHVHENIAAQSECSKDAAIRGTKKVATTERETRNKAQLDPTFSNSREKFKVWRYCNELIRRAATTTEVYVSSMVLQILENNMNDLFSNSFKQYQDLKRQAYVDDMEAGGGVRNETIDLDKFFHDVEDVKNDMMAVEKLHKKLQESNAESKMVQNANKMKLLRSKMDSDFTHLLKIVKVIKGKLEALDNSNVEQRKIPGCGPGSSADRTRTSIVSGLGKKLKIMMDDFQELRAQINEEYKEIIGRRYFTIIGQKANDELIENLISSGNGEDFL